MGSQAENVDKRQSINTVAASVIGLSLVCWILLMWAVFDHSSPVMKLMMPMTPEWQVANVLAVFCMWSVMMVAMMLPSAAPMIFTYRKVTGSQGQTGRIWYFVTAYIFIWTFFSALATAAQWLLQDKGLISPMLVSNSAAMTGFLLLIAGVFQFTPLKRTCLANCRSPFGFLMSEWRDGNSGAWAMGMHHGLVCLGCCWALMLLLFAGGVMNLAWVAILALAVLVEKLVPHGEKLAQLIGGALIISGLIFLAKTTLASQVP